METKGFLQFEIITNVLVNSASFEDLCCASTAIINIFYSFSPGTDIRRQNLTSIDRQILTLKSVSVLQGLHDVAENG